VIRKILPTLIFGILSCQHFADNEHSHWTAAAFEGEVEAMKGKDAEAVIESYGYPSRELTDPDGSTVYEYNFLHILRTPFTARTTFSGSPGLSTTRVYGGDVLQYGCNLWFKLAGKPLAVVKVRWRGNGCKS
jgi:hypothetical protein